MSGLQFLTAGAWVCIVGLIAGAFALGIESPRICAWVGRTCGGWRGAALARLNRWRTPDDCFRGVLPCEPVNVRHSPRVQRCTTRRPVSRWTVEGVTSDPGTDHQGDQAKPADPSEPVKQDVPILLNEPPSSRETEPEALWKQTAPRCYSSTGQRETQVDSAAPDCFRETPCEVTHDPVDTRPVPLELNERAGSPKTCPGCASLRRRYDAAASQARALRVHAEMDLHVIDCQQIQLMEAYGAEELLQATIAELCRREAELEWVGWELCRAADAAANPSSPEVEASSWTVLEIAIESWKGVNDVQG